MKTGFVKKCAAVFAALMIFSSFNSTVLASAAEDFYADTVFLGDSLTVGLKKYVSANDDCILHDSVFLATNGYMLSQTANEDGFSKHPEYKGSRLQPQKSIASIDPKKVFITMGINDSAGEISTLTSNYEKLLDAVKHAAPSAKIYMIAVFPMTTTKENSLRNNAKIDQINTSILKLAMRNNVNFVDFTDKLKNGNALERSYSSDDYVHFSNEGYDVWLAQMSSFVKFIERVSSVSSGNATIINVKEYVNGRSEASSSSKLVTKIPKGSSVEVLGQANDEWYLVRYDDKEAYVFKKYISAASENEGLTGKIVNVSEFANLRKLPDQAAEIAGTIEKGASVSISKLYYDPSWYRIIINGDPCYVSSDYVKID